MIWSFWVSIFQTTSAVHHQELMRTVYKTIVYNVQCNDVKFDVKLVKQIKLESLFLDIQIWSKFLDEKCFTNSSFEESSIARTKDLYVFEWHFPMLCFVGMAKHVRFLISTSVFTVSYAISPLSLANVAGLTLFVSASYMIADVMPMFKFRLILNAEFWAEFWRCVRNTNLELL